ncbi:MAG TPA: hypothetical protein DCZ49_05750 [Hyphomonadaceae bacterium]|nr:hypothetical protein [Hyphomonadaceae bacterium]
MSEAAIEPALFPWRDPMTRKMGLACVLGLGGFLVWAAFAPLKEGVAATGSVVVQDNRKVVQHLEGGIIAELKVREGDRVEAGQPLVVMTGAASLANREQTIKRLAALRAGIARLSALQSNTAAPDFAVIADLALSEDDRADIVGRERSVFNQQRQRLAADIALLNDRRQAALTTRDLRAGQIDIARRALAAAQEELALVSELFAQRLARRDQVTTLERNVANGEGEIARLNAERQDAAAQSVDMTNQIAQRRAEFAQEIAGDLAQARADLLTVEQELFAAQDVIDRAIVAAPVSGEVLNLRFATRGGVVRPGEAIMEIVPKEGDMLANVRIRPGDRDAVYEGQNVRTRLAAYRSWLSPRLAGEVVGVSADLKTDPDTGAQFYEARISVDPAELARARNLEIIPGMPVEVFIYSGRSRTALDYFVEPIAQSFSRGVASL